MLEGTGTGTRHLGIGSTGPVRLGVWARMLGRAQRSRHLPKTFDGTGFVLDAAGEVISIERSVRGAGDSCVVHIESAGCCTYNNAKY